MATNLIYSSIVWAAVRVTLIVGLSPRLTLFWISSPQISSIFPKFPQISFQILHFLPARLEQLKPPRSRVWIISRSQLYICFHLISLLIVRIIFGFHLYIYLHLISLLIVWIIFGSHQADSPQCWLSPCLSRPNPTSLCLSSRFHFFRIESISLFRVFPYWNYILINKLSRFVPNLLHDLFCLQCFHFVIFFYVSYPFLRFVIFFIFIPDLLHDLPLWPLPWSDPSPCCPCNTWACWSRGQKSK